MSVIFAWLLAFVFGYWMGTLAYEDILPWWIALPLAAIVGWYSGPIVNYISSFL